MHLTDEELERILREIARAAVEEMEPPAARDGGRGHPSPAAAGRTRCGSFRTDISAYDLRAGAGFPASAFLALLGQPVREGRVRKAGYREGEGPYWQLKLTVRNIVLI